MTLSTNEIIVVIRFCNSFFQVSTRPFFFLILLLSYYALPLSKIDLWWISKDIFIYALGMLPMIWFIQCLIWTDFIKEMSLELFLEEEKTYSFLSSARKCFRKGEQVRFSGAQAVSKKVFSEDKPFHCYSFLSNCYTSLNI